MWLLWKVVFTMQFQLLEPMFLHFILRSEPRLRLEVFELPAQQIAGLVDQAEQRVGGDLGRGGAQRVRIGRVRRVGLVTPAHGEGLGRILVPEAQTVLAEKVLIIEHQLLEAGACDIGELELGLLRRAGGDASFRDVLHAAARGLNHLIMGARPFVDEAIAEDERAVIDQLGGLKAAQLAVAAVPRKQAVGRAWMV